MEENGAFVNGHPLHFKFQDGNTIADLNQQPEYVQLFCASAFIRLDALRASGLRFGGRVRPSFEDAHLLHKFLLLSNRRSIAFLKDALYFYRKRAAATGLVDSGWSKAEKYRDQIFYGYLDLVKFARQKTGGVPAFTQNAIIYDMQFYMERLLHRTVAYDFSEQGFSDFLDLARALFAHIDTQEILFSRLPMLSLPLRTAMLHVFKGVEPPPLPLALQETGAGQALAVACSALGRNHIFRQGEREITPLWQKTVRHRFRGTILCTEQYFRLPFDETLPLSCTADGQNIPLIRDNKIFGGLV